MTNRTATITRTRDGAKFTAHIFDTLTAAQVYAIQHPVLIRNASGSLLRHSAQVHKLTNGTFAVI